MAYKLCFSLLVLAGCPAKLAAPGDESATPDASQAARFDAAENQHLDGGTTTLPTDAACGSQVTQLLANPAFDSAPLGTGWTQTLIDSTSPLITDEDGVVEHTAPYKAWIGGIEAPLGAVVKDSLVQNVSSPANTTHLVLTGMYDVRTSEAPSTTEFDTAKVYVTELDGTLIETALTASNVAPKTAWTMFGYAFTQNLAGKTVRVRISSTNDELDPTSFYFDSLALTATSGCPSGL